MGSDGFPRARRSHEIIVSTLGSGKVTFLAAQMVMSIADGVKTNGPIRRVDRVWMVARAGGRGVRR